MKLLDNILNHKHRYFYLSSLNKTHLLSNKIGTLHTKMYSNPDCEFVPLLNAFILFTDTEAIPYTLDNINTSINQEHWENNPVMYFQFNNYSSSISSFSSTALGFKSSSMSALMMRSIGSNYFTQNSNYHSIRNSLDDLPKLDKNSYKFINGFSLGTIYTIPRFSDSFMFRYDNLEERLLSNVSCEINLEACIVIRKDYLKEAIKLIVEDNDIDYSKVAIITNKILDSKLYEDQTFTRFYRRMFKSTTKDLGVTFIEVDSPTDYLFKKQPIINKSEIFNLLTTEAESTFDDSAF